MQLMKFVTRDTKDKNKIIVWCTTNSLITFRDFMQYVLDSMNNPRDCIKSQQKCMGCEREPLKKE